MLNVKNGTGSTDWMAFVKRLLKYTKSMQTDSLRKDWFKCLHTNDIFEIQWYFYEASNAAVVKIKFNIVLDRNTHNKKYMFYHSNDLNIMFWVSVSKKCVCLSVWYVWWRKRRGQCWWMLKICTCIFVKLKVFDLAS